MMRFDAGSQYYVDCNGEVWIWMPCGPPKPGQGSTGCTGSTGSTGSTGGAPIYAPDAETQTDGA